MMKLRVPWHDMRHLGGGILSDSVVDEDTNKTVGSILHSSHPTGRRISLFDGKYEEMQPLHGTTLVLCGQFCGLEVEMLYARNDREIDAAFAELSEKPDVTALALWLDLPPLVLESGSGCRAGV